MDPIVGVLSMGGAFVAIYLYTRWRTRHWKGIAAKCGVNVFRVTGWAWDLTLRGQAGKLDVRIAGSSLNKGGTQIVVTIPGPPGFSEVSIRREHKAPWKTHEIHVGSEFFDQTFYVEGPRPLVLAQLDAEVRGLLLETTSALITVGGQLEITDGALLAETVDPQLSRILPLLLRIGERLAQPVDVEQRLAQHAAHDPEPGVRLQAALELGVQGRDVILKLAEGLEDDAASAQAVSILAGELTFERTKAILIHSLRRRRSRTACVCLKSLGRSRAAEAIEVLSKVMAREKGEIATAAAEALGTAGGPAAEGPLIQALQRPQKDLRVAAAHALGRMGSPTAVLPLKEAIERFSDSDLDRAARQAIAEIQSRLPGASPGQLSLTGEEAGQLSLATDPAGQLSLGDTENPAGKD